MFTSIGDNGRGRWAKATIATSALCCAIAMFADYLNVRGIAGDFVQGMGFSLAIAPAMIALCVDKGWPSRLLAGAALRWLGEISYSVYVFQFLVLWNVQLGGAIRRASSACCSVNYYPHGVVRAKLLADRNSITVVAS